MSHLTLADDSGSLLLQTGDFLLLQADPTHDGLDTFRATESHLIAKYHNGVLLWPYSPPYDATAPLSSPIGTGAIGEDPSTDARD